KSPPGRSGGGACKRDPADRKTSAHRRSAPVVVSVPVRLERVRSPWREALRWVVNSLRVRGLRHKLRALSYGKPAPRPDPRLPADALQDRHRLGGAGLSLRPLLLTPFRRVHSLAWSSAWERAFAKAPV